jgi:hypothetical protein
MRAERGESSQGRTEAGVLVTAGATVCWRFPLRAAKANGNALTTGFGFVLSVRHVSLATAGFRDGAACFDDRRRRVSNLRLGI